MKKEDNKKRVFVNIVTGVEYATIGDKTAEWFFKDADFKEVTTDKEVPMKKVKSVKANKAKVTKKVIKPTK